MSNRRPIFRDDHEIFRQQARRFVAREIVPHYAKWQKAGIVPPELWRQAGAEGLLCCMVPQEYGGGGGDFGHSAIVQEELARVNAVGVGFALHSEIVVPYILAYGSEAQKRAWLPKMAGGEMIGAIAMSEPGTGSDLKAIRTTARRQGGDYVIDGQKTFISNGQNAGLVIVVCKTAPEKGAKGISLVCVEAGTPGFDKGRKLDKIGLHAQDTSELFFSGARVPVANRLGEENGGFGYLMHELAQERLILAVRAAASVEGMLERTLAYTRSRHVFGQAIFDYQNSRFKLAQAKAKTVMLRSYVDSCIALHMQRALSPVEAAMAKLNAAELQSQLLDDFLQLHGGYGYMSEYVIGSAWVDARVMRIYGGSDEIMKEIIARAL